MLHQAGEGHKVHPYSKELSECGTTVGDIRREVSHHLYALLCQVTSLVQSVAPVWACLQAFDQEAADPRPGFRADPTAVAGVAGVALALAVEESRGHARDARDDVLTVNKL